MLGLGSSAQLGIGIAVQLHDQFSNTAKKVNQQLLQMRRNASSLSESAVKDYKNFNTGVAAASGAAAMGMYQMAKSGAELQHRTTQMLVIGGKELNLSGKQLNKITDQVSQNYARQPQEVSDAMLENIRAGLRGNLSMITEYQTALASIVGEQLGGEQGVASKTLGGMIAFDIPQKNFKDFANALGSISNNTKASVYGLGESLEYTAFTARQQNISFKETLAMLGLLSQASIEGSAAGTALNNAILYIGDSLSSLASPKKKAMWGMLGLDRSKMADLFNSGQAGKVISIMNAQAAKLSPIERNAILKNIGNMRGLRAILGLNPSKNGQENKSFEALMKDMDSWMKNDTVRKQAKAATNDEWGEIERFKGAWESFKRDFSTAVGPTLRMLLSGASKFLGFISAFSNTGVGKVFLSLAMVTLPIIGLFATARVALSMFTLGLNNATKMMQLGGGKGIIGGYLGNMFASLGGGRTGSFAVNKAGRHYVTAGNSVNFGGKVFGPGQLLPKAFGATTATGGALSGLMGGLFGGAASSAAGASLAAKGANMGTKALSLSGKILGAGLRMLPLVGAGFLLLDAVTTIMGLMGGNKNRPGKGEGRLGTYGEEYITALNRALSMNTSTESLDQVRLNMAASKHGQPLNQNIIVNVDGMNVGGAQLSQSTQSELKNLDFNFTNPH